ncbi:hypothetical protein GW17_00038950 [Ensete ventricosum]|nr:hypothetical protein GW17_00038950 [Ensete ventricosum]
MTSLSLSLPLLRHYRRCPCTSDRAGRGRAAGGCPLAGAPRVAAPCGRTVGCNPLRAGRSRSCSQSATAPAGGRPLRAVAPAGDRPLQGALAAAGRPLASGRAKPCCPSSSLFLL